MTFARSLLFTLILFVFGGTPGALAAQAKVTKAKITSQPVSVVAELGQSVTFGVACTSTVPVTFQWRWNKQPLAGKTSSSLVINPVTPGAAGKYDVVITNGAGLIASRVVNLTVNLAPPSLAVDDIIQGSFTLKIARETVDSDGAFIVKGSNTLQDPEVPSDSYTFSYKRLAKNKATLVINGLIYDADLGGYIKSMETHTLTFVGIASDGRLLANTSLKGYALPPSGYVQKKLNFTGTGSIAVERAVSADLAQGSSAGGTLVISGGITMSPPSSAIQSGGNLILSGSGAQIPGGAIVAPSN